MYRIVSANIQNFDAETLGYYKESHYKWETKFMLLVVQSKLVVVPNTFCDSLIFGKNLGLSKSNDTQVHTVTLLEGFYAYNLRLILYVTWWDCVCVCVMSIFVKGVNVTAYDLQASPLVV